MGGTGVAVRSVRCRGAGTRRPDETATWPAYEVCLVRRGCFRYRDRRGAVLVDPTTALFGSLDELDYEVDHPQPGGDDDTFLFLDVAAMAAVSGGEPALPLAVRTTPVLDLAHRRLVVVNGRHPDGPLAEERALDLVAGLLGEADAGPAGTGRPRTTRSARQAVEDACAVLVADPDLPLLDLAALVGCAPHHLSRSFRRHTGLGVAAYRLMLRSARALDGLTAGAASLSELAAACGFADHAHLTRTLVSRYGLTPSALRAELAQAAGPRG